MRHRTRHPWRSSAAAREAVLGLTCYAAYLLVRRAVWNDAGRQRAQANADRVVRLEERLGLRIEPRIQALALPHQRLVDGLNVGYGAGNLALSVGWLILLHRRADPLFIRERRAAITAFCAAVPVFLVFPCAPPRSRDDVADTLLDRGVDLAHPFLVRFYNPIAAMPSHHVAFAVVSGFGLASRRRGLSRLAWRSYPLAVTGVVIGTGNHFTLDTVAGAALGALARALTR